MANESMKQQFLTIIKPSFGGGLLTIAIGIVVAVAIMTPQFYSQFNLDRYSTFVKGEPSEIAKNVMEANEAINTSPIVADLSVFLAWSLTGVFGFLALNSIVQIVKRSLQTIDEVEHAVVDKKSAERELVDKVALRLIALLLLYAYYMVGINLLLPVLTVLSQYTLSSGPFALLLPLGAMIIITSLSVHTGIVLLRLLLLRTRIFFTS